MRDDRRSAEDVSKWIRDFLSQRDGDIEPDPDQDLFAEGLLDSLGVVSLVTGLESRFGARLTEKDFQDLRFSTIRGLSAIVSEARERSG